MSKNSSNFPASELIGDQTTSAMRQVARLGVLGEDDQKEKEEVYRYWDTLGDAARFATAWELVLQTWELLGKPSDKLRFQRTAVRLIRRR